MSDAQRDDGVDDMPERIPPSSGTAITRVSAAGFQPRLSCCHITPGWKGRHPELRVASGIYIDLCGVVDQSLIVPGKSAPTYICAEYLPTYTALVSAMCCAYPCSTGKAS